MNAPFTDLDLQESIDLRRKDIYTTKLTMSVGELTNMYRDGDLEIQPAFQRLFRWSIGQKSSLIESLLLGVPLPSIFVNQRGDGSWDLIDGVQRISTILEFQGVLKDADGRDVDPISLRGTDYLPQLEGVYWGELQGRPNLTVEQQRIVKRAPIDVTIVGRESDGAAKFDLFQRLNSGGSHLSEQEIRNAMIVMINEDMSAWIRELASYEPFVNSVALTEKNVLEAYDHELILRFLVLSQMQDEELSGIRDISDLLTDQAKKRADDFPSTRESDELVFKQTFSLIDEAFPGQDAFKRYDVTKERFLGGFIISPFEAITLGVAENLENWLALETTERSTQLREKVVDLWRCEEFRRNSGAGVRANTRIKATVPLARRHFAL